MTYSAGIVGRLYTLKKDQNRAASFEGNQTWYDFLVAPSCPPDKRLHIRGGNATSEDNFDGSIYDSFTPTIVCDFENEAETQLALSFTNADYYLPIILCYYGDWIGYRTFHPTYELPIFDCPIGNEVASAAEAESQIDTWLNGYTAWAYYRFPLRGVVLRNDGQVGVNYAIMPIDMVNRGRGYLYRDARARNSLAQ